MEFTSIDALQSAMRERRYIAERGLATSLYLALKLRRALFLEGEAGVGKTEVAKIMASLLDTDLIRLQCYEGLDVHHAVYEWNYTRQMMHIRLLEARGERADEAELFGPEFLLRRPLLQAIEQSRQKPPVLLIDELDRSDEEFEAFLLEVLSDFQITIPEIGTLRAEQPPVVVLTSNRTREVHDALKRRCLYLFIDYPTLQEELAVVRLKVPDLNPKLAQQAVEFVQKLRTADMRKSPSISETLDWANALVALNARHLDKNTLEETLSVLLKHEADLQKARRQILSPPPRQKPDEYDFGRFSGN